MKTAGSGGVHTGKVSSTTHSDTLNGSGIWLRRSPPIATYGSFAADPLQKLAQRQSEGSRKRCEISKSNLARPALKIGDVNLVDPRVLGEVDLSPAALLAEFPDSLPNLDADI